MNVTEICKRPAVTILQTEELGAAARLMRERHIGYLVVVEPHLPGSFRPTGVLTDRDIVVAVVARGEDPRQLRVGDVMTRQPTVVEESKSLSYALEQMRRIGVRRVPVVGALGELTGVLSLDDVLDTLARDLHGVASSIRSELHMEAALRP
ncbi:MAG TPA: CBS domain-containing protein [Steroidobacteraceae bacterium]|nr:CBS domain-containing protein [Steroidobacteraceae bacterium]